MAAGSSASQGGFSSLSVINAPSSFGSGINSVSNQATYGGSATTSMKG